jgi:phosphoglycolate phosphatase
MATPAIKLLIFDLDGTLLDTLSDLFSAANALLRKHGLAEATKPEVRRAIGNGVRRLVAQLFAIAKPTEEQLDMLTSEFLKLYADRVLDETKPFEGVVEFLENNRRKVALVTNKPIALTRRLVDGTELRRFTWIEILGGDSLRERKPHPLPLLKCLETAGVSAHEAVMIGDGLPDLEAAARAGVRSIAITGGYTDQESFAAAKLGTEPTLTIRSFRELPRALDKLERPT